MGHHTIRTKYPPTQRSLIPEKFKIFLTCQGGTDFSVYVFLQRYIADQVLVHLRRERQEAQRRCDALKMIFRVSQTRNVVNFVYPNSCQIMPQKPTKGTGLSESCCKLKCIHDRLVRSNTYFNNGISANLDTKNARCPNTSYFIDVNTWMGASKTDTVTIDRQLKCASHDETI